MVYERAQLQIAPVHRQSARLTPHIVESIGESCQWRRMPSPETARKSLPGGHSATSKRTIELSYDR